jgi:hypothetical protein
MTNPDTDKKLCPTCRGNKVLEGACQVSPEWEGVKTPEQEPCTPEESCPGQLCTPDTKCPTCNGEGYIEGQ